MRPMTDPPATAAEVATFIQVVLMPHYSEANAAYDGPTVLRADAREDLEEIVDMLRGLPDVPMEVPPRA